MYEKKDQTRLWYGSTEKSTVPLSKGKFEAVLLTFLISSKSTAFVHHFRSANLDSFHSSHHSGSLTAGPDYRSADQWPADRQAGLISHHSTGADRLEPASKSNLRSFTSAVRSQTARSRACSVRRAQCQFDQQSVSSSFSASLFAQRHFGSQFSYLAGPKQNAKPGLRRAGQPKRGPFAKQKLLLFGLLNPRY